MIEAGTLHPDTEVGDWYSQKKFESGEPAWRLVVLMIAIRNDVVRYGDKSRSGLINESSNTKFRFDFDDKLLGDGALQVNRGSTTDIIAVSRTPDNFQLIWDWRRISRTPSGRETTEAISRRNDPNSQNADFSYLTDSLIAAYLGTPHPLGE